ncbi:hypothetical protein GMMP13_810006 [Candidatus Magnetomoraceae bacterium gMMP-13]
MVIYNLNITNSIVFPNKTNTPLIVDTDAVLTRSVPLELFEPVSRRNPQTV